MDFLTVTQAAILAGVSRQYIQAEILRGNLDATKLDPDRATSAYMIPRKAFDSWQKKRRAQPEKD